MNNERPYKRLNPRALSLMLRRVGAKHGIVLSAHRLRKFFETYVTAGGVHPVTAKYWMDLTLGGDIESRCIIPPENLQKEQYSKAYPYVDIRESARAPFLVGWKINDHTRRRRERIGWG